MVLVVGVVDGVVVTGEGGEVVGVVGVGGLGVVWVGDGEGTGGEVVGA